MNTEQTSSQGQPSVQATQQEMTNPPTESGKAPRRRLRWILASGLAAAALTIGGAGFGLGYVVADQSSGSTGQFQTVPGGGPGNGQPPPMGQQGGPMGQQGGTTQQDGGTGNAPDFNGDGQPDAQSDQGSTEGSSSTQGSSTT